MNENHDEISQVIDHFMSSNMIVIAISIASLLSGALGSYDSLAKCLYEEEVADAQVMPLLSDFPIADGKFLMTFYVQDTLWNKANCNVDGTDAVKVC